MKQYRKIYVKRADAVRVSEEINKQYGAFTVRVHKLRNGKFWVGSDFEWLNRY